MKKLLTIFFIFLLFNIPAQADDIASGFEDKSDFKNNVTDFNKWLHDNGHHQYLIMETKEICKTTEKGSQAWYDNKCNKRAKNNLKNPLNESEINFTKIGGKFVQTQNLIGIH